MLESREDLQAWGDQVLHEVASLGATAAEVQVEAQTGFDVQVRQGALERLVHHQNVGLQVTAYVGQQVGTASGNVLDTSSLALLCRKAVSLAKAASPDPYAGLPDPAYLVSDPVDCGLYHPSPYGVDQALAEAHQLEALALAADSRLQGEGSGIEVSQSRTCLCNSHGFSVTEEASSWSRSCTLVGNFAEGRVREGDYTVARAYEDQGSLETLAKQASERTLRREGARALGRTLECPVLLVPELASSLLGYFAAAIRGRAIFRRASFACDGLGQAFFPKEVSLVQDPHRLGGLASAPWDGEGVATQPWAVVEQGCLTDYLMSSYSARQLKRQTTGQVGGPFNLQAIDCRYDQASLDDLLGVMGSGFLVTEFMGHGVNLVTGDFSQGAFGFWVEGGKIAYPVHEVTVAGHLPTWFKDTLAIGSDRDERGSCQAGAWLIKQATVAGEA